MVSSTRILALYLAPCLARNVNREPTWDGWRRGEERRGAQSLVIVTQTSTDADVGINLEKSQWLFCKNLVSYRLTPQLPSRNTAICEYASV